MFKEKKNNSTWISIWFDILKNKQGGFAGKSCANATDNMALL